MAARLTGNRHVRYQAMVVNVGVECSQEGQGQASRRAEGLKGSTHDRTGGNRGKCARQYALLPECRTHDRTGGNNNVPGTRFWQALF